MDPTAVSTVESHRHEGAANAPGHVPLQPRPSAHMPLGRSRLLPDKQVAATRLTWLAQLLTACMLMLLAVAPRADPALQGRVVSVPDGDTLTLQDAAGQNRRIRLAYVAAPDLRQPFGKEAQSSLAAMVLGREIRVEIQSSATDELLLAEIITPEGTNANLELLRRGIAWHNDTGAPSATVRAHYLSAMREAQKERLGVWALDRLELPEDFRARIKRLQRWWVYVSVGFGVLALLSVIVHAHRSRIDAWLAQQDAMEEERAERRRLTNAAQKAEAAERELTREIANREMDRLAKARRSRERAERHPPASNGSDPN